MKTLLIDNGTANLTELQHLFAGLPLRIIARAAFSTDQIADAELIVLSGSSTIPILGHEALYAAQIKLIQETSLPLLGICQGFQLLAYAYGADLIRFDDRFRGIRELTLYKPEHPLFRDLPNRRVYESHRWKVERLPDAFELLASSDDGPEIIAHKHKPLFGFQFHPEKRTGETAGPALVSNLLATIQHGAKEAA